MCRVTKVALPLASLLLAASAGCSKVDPYPQGTVVGLVTVDGQPVPSGQITFSPAANGRGPVTGATIKDGRFRCEHVPIGALTVTFTLHAAEMRRFTDVTGTVRKVPQDILPAAYRAGVPVEIEAGENVRDFPLSTRPAS